MTVYDNNFEGRKAGIIPELFSVLTNPTSPQAWAQMVMHAWDIADMVNKAEELKTLFPSRLELSVKELIGWRDMPPEQIVGMAKNQLRDLLVAEIDREKTHLAFAKEKPLTVSMSRLGWNLLQYLHFFDTFKAITINLPSEYGLLIPAERYWRKFYARGRPSFRDAFIMACKDLVDWNLPFQILTEDVGMSETLAKAYIKHAFYDPSPFELARLHRTIPLPAKYVVRKLKNVGISDEDLGYFTAWIAKEAIKDELIAISRILQDEYAMGTLQMKAFEDFHREWLFSDDEIKLRKETAEILRAKYVLKLRRDAKIYLYRRGILTEDELYNELVKLGIAEEVANAIVENEAAKKGIVWTK
jgi:hypothetical protein